MYEFEYHKITGRHLFKPINEEAKKLCLMINRKNLTIDLLQYYLDHGFDIKLTPKINLPDNMLALF